ncbi:MAG TPA: FHA domain-containing protein [Pseudomonadales bacterium]|nr:FHA domain-containing protein [Pseudomonadales bacterium]
MKIIVIRDDKPIDQITFTGEVALIGRKSDCDVSIKDPAVSGNHARLQKMGDSYVISDLGSTNGIQMKGRRIKQQMLKNEDVVTIGAHKLKFLIGDGSQPAKEPPKAFKRSQGFLKVLNGEHEGQKILLDEGLTTIGEPGIQVAAVSRRPQGHFIIHVDGGKDKERVPLVNGEPTGFKSRKLESGDTIEIAGIRMQYEAP